MYLVKMFCIVILSASFICYLANDGAIEPLRALEFSTFTVVKRVTPTLRSWLLPLLAFLVLPLVGWGLHLLEPLMHSHNWHVQPPLALWEDPFVQEYEAIFSYFDFSVLPVPTSGPKRNTLAVYAKVFLIKVNEHLQYSSDLRAFFFDHPQLIPLVGFFPVYNPGTGTLQLEKTVVSARHLRRKLHSIENQHLKRLLKQTVDHLQAQG
jgi:hypothetical protein